MSSIVVNTDGSSSSCSGDYCHTRDSVFGEDHLYFVKMGVLMSYDPIRMISSVVNTAGSPNFCSGDHCYTRDLAFGGGRLYFVKMGVLMSYVPTNRISFVGNTAGAPDMCSGNHCHTRDLLFREEEICYGGTCSLPQLYCVKMGVLMSYVPTIMTSHVVNTAGSPNTCVGDHCYTRDLVLGGGNLYFVKMGALMSFDTTRGTSVVVNTSGYPGSCSGDHCYTRDLAFTVSESSPADPPGHPTWRIVMLICIACLCLLCCCVVGIVVAIMYYRKANSTREEVGSEVSEQ